MILVAAMLIIAVLIIYQSTIGGDNGIAATAANRGAAIGRSIEAIDP